MLDHHRQSAWRRPRTGCAAGRRCAHSSTVPVALPELEEQFDLPAGAAPAPAPRPDAEQRRRGTLVTSSVQSGQRQRRRAAGSCPPVWPPRAACAAARRPPSGGTGAASSRAGSRAATPQHAPPAVDRSRVCPRQPGAAGRAAPRRRRRPPLPVGARQPIRPLLGDLAQARARLQKPRSVDPQRRRPATARAAGRPARSWVRPARSAGPSSAPLSQVEADGQLEGGLACRCATRPPQPAPDRRPARPAGGSWCCPATHDRRRTAPAAARHRRRRGDRAPGRRPASRAPARPPPGLKRWASPCGLIAAPRPPRVWVNWCSVAAGCGQPAQHQRLRRTARRSACGGGGRSRSPRPPRRRRRSGRAAGRRPTCGETGHAGTSSRRAGGSAPPPCQSGPRCHPVTPKLMPMGHGMPCPRRCLHRPSRNHFNWSRSGTDVRNLPRALPYSARPLLDRALASSTVYGFASSYPGSPSMLWALLAATYALLPETLRSWLAAVRPSASVGRAERRGPCAARRTRRNRRCAWSPPRRCHAPAPGCRRPGRTPAGARELRIFLGHDPSLPVQANDLRRPGEGAEHEYDAAVLPQVRDRLDPATDEIDVGDRIWRREPGTRRSRPLARD